MNVSDVTHLRHEFIKMAIYNGANNELAQDIAQDIFVKLCEIQEKEGNINRLTYKGKINTVYLYSMVRNRTLNIKRKSERMIRLEIDAIIPEHNMIEIEIENKLINMGAWYHKLYNAYFNDSISMRELAEKSGISLTTLWYNIKYIKNEIKPIFNSESAK